MAQSRASLHVVSDGAVKGLRKADRRKTVTSAAAGGDRLELLQALRARVAKAIDARDTPARDLAALSRRLIEVSREIESIIAQQEQEVAESVVAEDEEFDADAL